MPRVAVVTDSTCDLDSGTTASAGIHVVPLTVHFGDQALRDGIDISSTEFVARLPNTSTLPTTAQPSAGEFEAAYRSLAGDFDEIVSVHISGKLSGTVGAARIAAAAMRDELPVEVVDTQTVSLGLGFRALQAADLAGTGLSAREIAERLASIYDVPVVAFFPDTLDYLQKGGRIGKAQALLGSLLSLKPILRISEGQVVPFERTRTRGRATRGLIDFVRSIEHPVRIGVLHSTTPAEAAEIAGELQPLTPDHDVVIAQMGPVILTHLGPGGMGVVAMSGGR